MTFVAAQRNIGSLPRLLAPTHDLGADFVLVSNVVPHTPAMAAEILRSAVAASFPDASWRQEMTRMAPDDRSQSALTALPEHEPIWLHPGTVSGPQRNRCCYVYEGMLAVGWDGRVAPCPSFLHTHPEYVSSLAANACGRRESCSVHERGRHVHIAHAA